MVIAVSHLVKLAFLMVREVVLMEKLVVQMEIFGILLQMVTLDCLMVRVVPHLVILAFLMVTKVVLMEK